MSDLRALTIRQPGASLIAAGVQTIHTDKRRTSYRGPVLIHAGKAKPSRCARCRGFGYEQVGAADVDCCSECGGCGMAWPWAEAPPRLPLGAVVAVADLTDCVPTGSVTFDPDLRSTWATGRNPEPYCFAPESQLPLGDFTPGRWAWLLDNVRPIDPIPAKGRQGLWRPDADLVAAVDEVTA